MSAWTCRQCAGKADPKIVPPRSRIPSWKGLGADSEEKREPASDIDTVLVDSLKALDPNRPIREADIQFAPLPVPVIPRLGTDVKRRESGPAFNRSCEMPPTRFKSIASFKHSRSIG